MKSNKPINKKVTINLNIKKFINLMNKKFLSYTVIR